MHSVHPLPAVHRSTVTWNLVLVIFKVKLIIIAELSMAKRESVSEKGQCPSLSLLYFKTSKQNRHKPKQDWVCLGLMEPWDRGVSQREVEQVLCGGDLDVLSP